MTRLHVAVVFTLAAACGHQPAPVLVPLTRPTPHAIEDEQSSALVLLAVRAALDSVGRPRSLPIAAYCLSIGPLPQAEEPPVAILRAFTDEVPRVVGASSCGSEAGGYTIYGLASGKRAWRVFATVPKLLSAERARVSFGYWRGALDGAGWDCLAARTNEQWVLAECRLSFAA